MKAPGLGGFGCAARSAFQRKALTMLQCQRKSFTDLESEIEEFVTQSSNSPELKAMITDAQIHVIKYMPAKYLGDVLSLGQLFANERASFTWGDAIYVAPVSRPLTTMMYGDVGVVGTYETTSRCFFDASNIRGIELYQDWIRYQKRAYRDLTTTVHASSANRELRNDFRTRFGIDCVFFRPDETCNDYVEVSRDWWFAITHWDAHGRVGHGYSAAVRDLKWCVITPDAFEAAARGYKAHLHTSLTASQQYVSGHYSTLSTDVLGAYQSGKQVVICDFV